MLATRFSSGNGWRSEMAYQSRLGDQSRLRTFETLALLSKRAQYNPAANVMF